MHKMENQISKRRSTRISSVENVKPNLKRKATVPLAANNPSGRPALKNLTNNKNTSLKMSGQNYEKKIPNYLKPTISTQQKCTKKKVQLDQEKSMKKSQVQIPQKIVQELSVKSASENYFDFEEETENKEPGEETEKDETQMKLSNEDIASPLRIDIVPMRKFIRSTPKPPVNQVLSILKSSLSSPLTKTPRTIERKLPQFFKTTTPQEAVESSSGSVQFGDEVNTSFDQPPRRSYTRQRPVMNFSEFDEPSSDEESKKREKEEEAVRKEPEAKPKKQKKTKKTAQDKQFEELAAAMNSQFSEVEGFQLVVE